MARAGYCRVCQANVWLSDNGGCINGHGVEDVSSPYEVEPVPEQHPAASMPLQHAAPVRWPRLIVVVIIGLVLGVVALCGLGAIVARPLANRGAAVASEWDGRLAEDYPGWKRAGFIVNSFTGTGGSVTRYSFGLVPPGRTFVVTIVYKSQDGSPAMLEDEVLRPGGEYSDRAESLLDYIDAQYVKKGKTNIMVTSDSSGSVTVNWAKVRRLGPFHSSVRDFDVLDFDDSTGEWFDEERL